jgi:hemoglobin
MTKLVKLVLILSAVALPALGCKKENAATSAAPPAAGERSLYDRLGGETAIKAVVDEFVANVAADARINTFFAGADLDRLKGHLVAQIGQATGGPQKYTGRDMKTAHAGMGVDDAAFNALVEDLTRALDKFSVPEREKGEVLAILAPMKAQIVEK